MPSVTRPSIARPVTTSRSLRRAASRLARIALVASSLLSPSLAFAQAAPTSDTGDTAWILAATALVLFMTIPGLALFYGGLVRTKNVLSVLMQCLALTALMTILWLAIGYTLCFGVGSGVLGAYLGDLGQAFLAGVSADDVYPGHGDPDGAVLLVPMHLCDHHARSDHWRLRRANALLGGAALLQSLAHRRLRADLPHDVGWRPVQ